MDNILTIFNQEPKMPQTCMLEIARREKALRKKKKMSRAELSKRSNVSYGSLKRFEETGEISLASLVKLAIVLDHYEDLDVLFREEKPGSNEEIINRSD